MNITVIGAGSWGTALALHLCDNQNQVQLWSHDAEQRGALNKDRCNSHYLPGFSFPVNLKIANSLAKAIASSEHVLIAVPSSAFRTVLTQIQPHLKSTTSLLWATKGLDCKSGELLSQVATETLGERQMGIITGPSFAKEVAAKKPTAILIAGNNPKANEQLQTLYHAPYFRTYLSTDMVGAQLGGACKNVLAIAVGISDGLGYGANARAGLITRGLSEMMRLGAAFGAQSETLIGLSGLGDLILTCTDSQSRNRRFGLALGKTQSIGKAKEKIDQVIEGIENAKTVYKRAQQFQLSTPIIDQVYQILHQGVSPKEAVAALLARKARNHEHMG